MAKCFRCLENISFLDNIPSNPDNAGTAIFDFGYGSEHDQLGYQSIAKDELSKRYQKLLTCERIVGYICDKCFEDIAPHLEGYKVIRSSKLEREL